MDRLTSIDKLAELIPDVIETEQSHVGLLWGERQKIAEAILDKCVIIVKNAQFIPRPITHENSSIRKCCPEFVKCIECKYKMFSDFDLECSKGYKGIVNRNDGCDKGERK